MGRERAFGLPLLTKELIEQAARRRTYIVRSVYAILLFGFALLIFWGKSIAESVAHLKCLGRGARCSSFFFY